MSPQARLLVGAVYGTRLQAGDDEWIDAGVFDDLATEALAAYERIVGLDLGDRPR